MCEAAGGFLDSAVSVAQLISSWRDKLGRHGYLQPQVVLRNPPVDRLMPVERLTRCELLTKQFTVNDWLINNLHFRSTTILVYYHELMMN